LTWARRSRGYKGPIEGRRIPRNKKTRPGDQDSGDDRDNANDSNDSNGNEATGRPRQIEVRARTAEVNANDGVGKGEAEGPALYLICFKNIWTW
jgi:hypothetical protein